MATRNSRDSRVTFLATCISILVGAVLLIVIFFYKTDFIRHNDKQVFESQQNRINNERIKEIFKFPPPTFEFEKISTETEASFQVTTSGSTTKSTTSTTNFVWTDFNLEDLETVKITTRHQWPETRSTTTTKTSTSTTAPPQPETTTADTRLSNDSAILQQLDIKGQILFIENRQVKTLNLSDGTVKSGPDFPSDAKGYTGALVGDDLIICGGITSTFNLTNDCHVLSRDEANEFRKIEGGLLEPRAEAASVALNESVLFISGGLGSNSTEFLGPNGSNFGAEFPVNLDNHCMVKKDDENVLIIGGRAKSFSGSGNEAKGYIFSYNLANQTFSFYSILRTPRFRHLCGTFKYPGSNLTALIVAGGVVEDLPRPEHLDSVEIFLLEAPVYIPGPKLPFGASSMRSSMVSLNNTVIITNGEMMFALDVLGMKWVELEHKSPVKSHGLAIYWE